MLKNGKILDPKVADPFESYHAVFADKRRLQWSLAGAMAIIGLLVLALFAASIRPVQVVIKDRVHGAHPIISQAQIQPAVTATDARVFFINMLRLRFGWSSISIERDMQNYLAQCAKEHREREIAYLKEPVVASSSSNAESQNRLYLWKSAGLANTLIWPENIDDVVCSPQEQGIWRCEVTAQIVSEKTQGDVALAPPVRMVFLATLYPVRHTVHTPSGLLVGSLKHHVLDPGGLP